MENGTPLLDIKPHIPEDRQRVERVEKKKRGKGISEPKRIYPHGREIRRE
jgi:tRNA (Thr-GGU) A37 N-methylase